MSLSYSGLWKLLIDKNMNKMNLIKDVGVSSRIVAKMTKGKPISITILEKVCDKLNCDVRDLVHFVSEKGSETK